MKKCEKCGAIQKDINSICKYPIANGICGGNLNTIPDDMDMMPKQPQVDFKLLQKTFHDCACGERIACDKEAQNLNLFVELLSTKPTFAQRAYKELNKLNK